MIALRITKMKVGFGVWQAIKSYKGSAAQNHFHSYTRDEEALKNIKETIDYKTINKNSKGRFMYREFLFQEKVEQNYVAPLDCYLLPIGKWTRQEIRTYLKDGEQTGSEVDNSSIVTACEPSFEGIFKDYYTKIGKKGYKFILSEEIGKLSLMSESEFEDFVKVLGGNYATILKDIQGAKKRT